MIAIKTFADRHPIASYFVLTFTISWGGALLVIGAGPMAGTEGTSDPRFVYALWAMLAGPSISGVLLTGLVGGGNGLRALLSRVVKWQAPARWHTVALLAAPMVWGATLLALSLASPKFLPAIATVDNRIRLMLIGLAVALSAGVFEEIGWTGFAIPQIRLRHGVFATGVIVGVLWGAWHLLVSVFWAGGESAGDLPPAVFLSASALAVLVGYLAAFRVLMVWVYEHTGSVLVAMLMHVSLTASVLILDPQGLSGRTMLTYSFALAASAWGVVAVLRVAAKKAPSWEKFRGPTSSRQRSTATF